MEDIRSKLLTTVLEICWVGLLSLLQLEMKFGVSYVLQMDFVTDSTKELRA